jgi:Ca-activated chloride channel family protein
VSAIAAQEQLVKHRLLTPIAALALTLSALLASAATARADGLIIIEREPRMRVQQLAVKYHHVDVAIENNISTTKIDQVFYNPNPMQMEGTYIFPLPDDAAVSNFSMWMNGKEMQGELLDAPKAREIYEGIVRKMQDPGLLEYVGRKAFKCRVFPIPAHGDTRIALSYSQVVPSDRNLSSYMYPLNTEKFSSAPLNSCVVKVSIKSARKITSVYSPSHTVDVVRKSDNEVLATYEASNVLPTTDFSLFFGTTASALGVDLAAHRNEGEDGYFLAMIAPVYEIPEEQVLAKDVVFVCDTSGSMLEENRMEKLLMKSSFWIPFPTTRQLK